MTTARVKFTSSKQLWFAQNSLPLWLKWQLRAFDAAKAVCCDLLKIHYLCGWNDNLNGAKYHRCKVVICSKFITFVVEMTTWYSIFNHSLWLWFAQNSLPLWLKWQPTRSMLRLVIRCDLLKIHYLCGWNDNNRNRWVTVSEVVICSKFITFVVEMTTIVSSKRLTCGLWFAQNSLPLWLKWQQRIVEYWTSFGCDLLKIHYLCGWNDNQTSLKQFWRCVVICSKFITFVVEMTT